MLGRAAHSVAFVVQFIHSDAQYKRKRMRAKPATFRRCDLKPKHLGMTDSNSTARLLCKGYIHFQRPL